MRIHINPEERGETQAVVVGLKWRPSPIGR